jgi:large subunit ribosomal protein L13
MKTYTVKASEIHRDWYVVDATDEVLGRLASQVATILRGKHKPQYSPHLDLGDHVVVINAERVRLTGRKLDQKTYFRHSGYPGGARETPVRTVLERHPEEVVRRAVRGMLPKNRLGRAMLRKLKIYRGPEHPHAAQQPRPAQPDRVRRLVTSTE